MTRWLFPNALDLVAVAAWVFASLHIVTALASVCGLSFPDPTAVDASDTDKVMEVGHEFAFAQFMVYAFSMLLAIAGALVYRRLRGGRGAVMRFSAAGLNPTLLLWGVAWMVAAVVVVEPLLELLPPAPETHGRGVWLLVMAVVAAPVCEEILCRGIILESVRSKYGVVAAWIFSSLFFGAIHGHAALMVNAVVAGLILGFVCLRSHSLLSSIFLHGVNNAMALAFLYLGVGNDTLMSLISDRGIYIAVYCSAAVVCAASFAYAAWWLKRERRAETAAKTEAEA